MTQDKISEAGLKTLRLRHPLDHMDEWWSFPLFMSYALVAMMLVGMWGGLVMNNTKPFPFGFPILISPALLFALWKGIER